MSDRSNAPIFKVNKAWAVIAASALTVAISTKLYRNYTRTKGEPISEANRAPAGSFVGESNVQRKSVYEGGGSSYLGRKGGDRFA